MKVTGHVFSPVIDHEPRLRRRLLRFVSALEINETLWLWISYIHCSIVCTILRCNGKIIDTTPRVVYGKKNFI